LSLVALLAGDGLIDFGFCDISFLDVMDLVFNWFPPVSCLGAPSWCLPAMGGSPTGCTLSGGPGIGEVKFDPCINPF
jgi:hypothetical protein